MMWRDKKSHAPEICFVNFIIIVVIYAVTQLHKQLILYHSCLCDYFSNKLDVNFEQFMGTNR